MRVLIIGGYGTFGGRLLDLLADEPRLTLIVAGRDLRAAEAFCAADGRRCGDQRAVGGHCGRRRWTVPTLWE